MITLLKMKVMRIVLIILTCVALGPSLFAQQKEFGWLIGTWKLKDKNSFEHWTYDENQKVLRGISYRVKNTADTTITEEIVIKYQSNSFYYIPDVAGGQGPVEFKVTKHDATTFVAENPEHDFPKIIRYKFVRKNNEDINEASIEGNGKTISYTFVRVR
jgi:hypothetical protein